MAATPGGQKHATGPRNAGQQRMTDANLAKNLEIYSAPGVTAHYAALDYLTACERLLFKTYVPAGGAVLDLGVGGGRTTPWLADRATCYLGVDNSPAMVEACRKKFPANEFMVADAADLSALKAKAFDAVIFAFNGIDFVLPEAARRRCFQEISRVLKPGGALIFSSHNARAILVRPSWNRERLRRIADDSAFGSGALKSALLAILTVLRAIVAYGQAGWGTLQRIARRVPTPVFWRGDGELLDSAHGGLFTHYSVPKTIMAEVSAAHLRPEKILANDYPNASRSLVTDWYYYVFIKPRKK
jgi:SAM-dependent methyltransferase